MSQPTHFPLQPSLYPSPLLFLWNNLKKYPGDIAKALLAVILTSAAILGMGYGLRTLVDKGFSAENNELLNMSALFLVGLAFILAFFGGYITDEKPITTLYPSFFIFGYILLQRIALKIYKLYAKTS